MTYMPPQMPRGWKRLFCLFTLGALASLAMPPVGAFWILFLCVPGFIILSQESESKWQSFSAGWAFGAGYFIAGLYWVSIALFVDLSSFWWVLPLSAIVGPGLLGLYYGFIPLLVRRWQNDSIAYALMFCALWAAVEWIRGHAFTGFPWNLPGYAWSKFSAVLQISSIIGIYGLTLLTLLWSLIFLVWPHRRLRNVLALSFIFVFAYGGARLYLHPANANNTPFLLRIVQPNIPQTLKWDERAEGDNFLLHLKLTGARKEGGKDPDIVIWPETALKADPAAVPDVIGAIAQYLPAQAILLTGSLRGEEDENGMRFYNSVSAIDVRGSIGAYDKHHLVPFGEYIPFRRYLDMTPIAAGIAKVGDFSSGEGPTTLSLPHDIPALSPLICYEAIFPGAVTDRNDRPGWLLNVTNDAWYGKSFGPYQHFEISRMRAIEEGLPLARAANTGISGMIDPLGRITAKLDLNETSYIDATLPGALPPTLYSRFGDLIFFGLLVLAALAGMSSATRRTFT